MGNNPTGNIEESNETFSSQFTENEVPLGNMTPSEMENFIEKINSWMLGDVSNPDDELTKKELNYIFNHFKFTDYEGVDEVPDFHLYRIENAEHLNRNHTDIGDNPQNNGAIRSFSKELRSTNEMLNDEWGDYQDIVIYRTVGNTPFFDTNKYANPYPNQTECFVPLDAMKVENMVTYDYTQYNALSKDYGIDLGYYGDYLNSVTVVDVKYDSSVKSITSTNGDKIYLK